MRSPISTQNRVLKKISYSLCYVTLSILWWSCANVTSPTGGPKDTIPPTLLRSIPKQQETDYKGSEIMLEFNELMKLKSAKEEIIITPDIKEVNYIAKKNLVLIDFKEKLKDSTTYSISFREAIQDLNEGNPVEDLHLAFSTGKEIDSLQIRGNVQQLLKGIPADKYTVAIYQSDTFNIFKHKPTYFTRTNKKGDYKIQNLKAGEYFVYAFEDKNKNLLLESKTEKFGFLPQPISLQNNKDSINLNTLVLDSRPITIAGIRSLGHFTKTRFNKNLTNYSLKSLDSTDKKIRHFFSTTQSEIDIFPNKPATDSTLIKLIAIDSLGQTMDSSFYVKQTTAKSLKEKIKISTNKIQLIDDVQTFYAELTATELIKQINPDSIYILQDTINQIPFATEDIRYDTSFRKIKIEKKFQKKDSIKWSKAKFVLGKMAFISIHGDSTKKTTEPIKYITAEETATLIIDFTSEKPNTLIELLNDQYKSIGLYPQTKKLTIKNINPSSVIIRAISDDNKNRQWDNGNPNKKILPERVTFYTNPEGKQLIPLRANWEVEIKWKLQ
jgi:Bacterial Ig-like domain